MDEEFQPTEHLRFVIRSENTSSGTKQVEILQQKWVMFIHGYSEDTEIEEWRDVETLWEN